MNSCPEELRPYDEALRLQTMRQDEINYINAQYNLRAFQVALAQFGAGLSGKTSHAEFFKKPFMQEASESIHNSNKESREEVAVFEMKQRTKLLQKQGMKISPT